MLKPQNLFNERLSPLISTKALEEIKGLKEKGYMIILLSSTLIPFVECFKDYCNADMGIGTHLESEDGILTGEMNGTYAYNNGKADIVKKLAKEYNIDLNNSYSYANQYIDVKFMRLTGFPVAVNASQCFVYMPEKITGVWQHFRIFSSKPVISRKNIGNA